MKNDSLGLNYENLIHSKQVTKISISIRVYSLMYDTLNEHLECCVGEKLCVLWRNSIRIWVSRFYTGIFQEEVRKITSCSQYRKSWGRNFKPWPPKYVKFAVLERRCSKNNCQTDGHFSRQIRNNLISVVQESALWPRKAKKCSRTLC